MYVYTHIHYYIHAFGLSTPQSIFNIMIRLKCSLSKEEEKVTQWQHAL